MVRRLSPIGGCGGHGNRIKVSDRDFHSCETAPQKLYSYSLSVVDIPPLNRLSAVDSQVSIAPSIAIMATPKRPRLDLQVAPAADSSQEVAPTNGDFRIAPVDPSTTLFPSGTDLQNGPDHPDGPLPLPLAFETYDEPREVPWGGTLPPHRTQTDDSRSRTSRGSATSAASSARYRALEAIILEERRRAAEREAELLRQLHTARTASAPSEPDAEDSHIPFQPSPVVSDRASRSSHFNSPLSALGVPDTDAEPSFQE